MIILLNHRKAVCLATYSLYYGLTNLSGTLPRNGLKMPKLEQHPLFDFLKLEPTAEVHRGIFWYIDDAIRVARDGWTHFGQILDKEIRNAQT